MKIQEGIEQDPHAIVLVRIFALWRDGHGPGQVHRGKGRRPVKIFVVVGEKSGGALRRRRAVAGSILGESQ